MIRAVLSACLLCLLSLPAAANSSGRLYFESLTDLQPIGDHYSNFGITFSSNALAVTSSLFHGIGNFTGNPSGRNVFGFRTGNQATMNVANGFTSGLSFFYSASDSAGVVTVWSGLNGTGTKLATITLSKSSSAGCQSGSMFCSWTAVGLTFDGQAKSVTFGGTAGKIAFDSVTVGAQFPSAVPESSTALLLGIGLLAFAGIARWARFSGRRA